MTEPSRSTTGDSTACWNGLVQQVQRHRRLIRIAGRLASAQIFVHRTLRPIIDLGIRIWLAQLFWVASMSTRFEGEAAAAFALDTAGSALASVEIAASLLLLCGLASRIAALVLIAVVLAAGPANAVTIILIVILASYPILGAGVLSIDQALSRGLQRIPLILVAAMTSFCGQLTKLAGPLYVLALRLLIAAVLAGPAIHRVTNTEAFATTAVDPMFATDLPLYASIPLALSITIGLGARFSAIVLLVLFVVARSMGGPLPAPQYWVALLGLLAAAGSLRWSIDAIVLPRLHDIRDALRTAGPAAGNVPNVVIAGAGFAGVAAARALRNCACRVTVIDRHNYHLFQPLLYQVATATLSPADIATPIREVFRDQLNTIVFLGRVTGVDPEQGAIFIDPDRTIPYDYLVLATGARHAYFGRDDEWQKHAPGLKKIEDATNIRRRLLIAFERAENSDDPAEQSRQLTFVIVGGGPTGVELAGSIAELARHGMAGEFRNIDPAHARVVLIQAHERLLPVLHPSLSTKAQASLEDLGVEVWTGRPVENVDEEGVVVSGQRLESPTVLWAAGVIASPAARWIGADSDRAGRSKVGSDLSVPGYPNVFAVGDTAFIEAPEGGQVPGIASAAKQAGRYVGSVIAARIEGSAAPGSFRYRHRGHLATIGRQAAVADFGWLRLSGAPAWWLWGLVHIYFLLEPRRRLSVALEWGWAYLTFRRSTRLITGDEGPP